MFKFRLDELLEAKSKETGRDVTLYQVARDTNISNTQVYRLRTPQQQVNSKTIQRIADFFGVDPKDTFDFVFVEEE